MKRAETTSGILLYFKYKLSRSALRQSALWITRGSLQFTVSVTVQSIDTSLKMSSQPSRVRQILYMVSEFSVLKHARSPKGKERPRQGPKTADFSLAWNMIGTVKKRLKVPPHPRWGKASFSYTFIPFSSWSFQLRLTCLCPAVSAAETLGQSRSVCPSPPRRRCENVLPSQLWPCGRPGSRW